MIFHVWKSTLLLVTCLLQTVMSKSCHYDNLRAGYGWAVVKSPGYPGQFPAQTQCWWKITAPVDYRIQLELIDFVLVKPNKKKQCVWQWLNIIEGRTDLLEGGGPPMLTLCGTNKPHLVISTGNTLRLNLHSNAAAVGSPYRGFSARYKYTSNDAVMPERSNRMADPGNAPAGTPSGSLSLGEALAPLAKPKPLPKNPNAVLMLKNRRTEARNQARNNGVNDENSSQNNAESLYGGRRRPPNSIQHYGRQPKPDLSPGSVQTPRELPPRRSKPLPHEITILLAVLGAVGGIILILFLIKKFYCDKAHKKGSGKFIHAYAHFRRFKKKKTNDGEPAKVNTITASLASVSGTLHSKDSGLATSNETDGLENGVSLVIRDNEIINSHRKSNRKQRHLSEVETIPTNHIKDPRFGGRPTGDANAPKFPQGMRGNGKRHEIATVSRLGAESSCSSGIGIEQGQGRRRVHRRHESSAQTTYRARDANKRDGGNDVATYGSRRAEREVENRGREQRHVYSRQNDDARKSRREMIERTRSRRRSYSPDYVDENKRSTWRERAYS